MADTVIFDGTTTLAFTLPEQHGQNPDYLEVRLNGPQLSAVRVVYDGDNGFAHLAEYFQDLAASWGGWQGQRNYESVEGDLRISATHDGHVRAVVGLQNPAEHEGWWRIETVLTIDPGEALAAAARAIVETLRN